jgi:hypothetical protein
MKTKEASLYTLLERLRAAEIHYRMRDDREGAVSNDVAVPGERWEIDLLGDGTIEIEVFRSDGTIHDGGKLEDLFQRFAER